jgi:hypothetical protein
VGHFEVAIGGVFWVAIRGKMDELKTLYKIPDSFIYFNPVSIDIQISGLL